MTSTGSTMVRRQLGRRLRELREAAGKTAVDVAQAGIASKAKLSRVENGWAVVKMADVRTLCWLYGADLATTEALCRLAQGTAEPGFWEEHAVAGGERLYPRLEAAASRMYCYETELVPPLLQTTEYLRAVATARPGTPSGYVESVLGDLARRLRRGFERVKPLELCAVLDAAVVTRVVGGSESMAAQLRKLGQASRLPHIDLRVLPWSAGAHAAMTGSFRLLDFESEDDPSVACLETMVGTRYVEQPAQLHQYRQVFAVLRHQAVPLVQYLAGGPASPAIDLRNGVSATR
ncbi:helix-turn-helix domain-containing protein [Spongisporangium articulatum]|uniref:Helix-turn-helix domain-containing protein n=1 Tax=Spongisporangium articulatum TaxID=3362603 RepID=A0ABW8ALQ0_9ACTN